LTATVTKDEYDPISNVHTVMFNFWDELISMVQHCLYEIDYENYEVKSCIKDGKFDWEDVALEALTKNE
jgi:hypothetical protein